MLKKTTLIVTLVVCSSLSSTCISNAFASNEGSEVTVNQDVYTQQLPSTITNFPSYDGIVKSKSSVSPQLVNEFKTRKKNVTYSEEFSNYSRVSDNLNTYGASSGGSITSTKSVSFTANVTGSIAGLGISLGGTLTSQIGYTLNVKPNKVVYMGYRVRYKVEKGFREYYDTVTGNIISSNNYVVKIPISGEYALLTP
jgi:hypothetical protein